MELQHELIVKKRRLLGIVSLTLCILAILSVGLLFESIRVYYSEAFKVMSIVTNALMLLAFILSIIDIRRKDSAKTLSKVTFGISVIYYSLYLTALAVMVVGMIII